MKKQVLIDIRAGKEINKLQKDVKIEVYALFNILAKFGRLNEPDAKKLGGKFNLFEIRLNYKGQWRFLYAYIEENIIIILCAFQKKTQKTPIKYIKLSQHRLKNYL